MFIEDGKAWYANKLTSNNNEGIAVKCMSFDQFVSINCIEQIDFLQMNIEGAEETAIDGMLNSISIVRNIAISCHDFLTENDNNKIQKKVEEFLKTNGFSLSYNDTGVAYRDSWVYGKRINH